MTIDEVYNLTKETMKNWKVTPTYSVGVVEATWVSIKLTIFSRN